MLEKILKLNGVKMLGKNNQKVIKGGFDLDGGCGEGTACVMGNFGHYGGVPSIPCMGDSEILICVNGVWVVE